MKNKKHLPRYGVGPIYVAVIMALTAMAVMLGHIGRFCYVSFRRRCEKGKELEYISPEYTLPSIFLYSAVSFLTAE